MRRRSPERIRVWRDMLHDWKRSGQTVTVMPASPLRMDAKKELIRSEPARAATTRTLYSARPHLALSSVLTDHVARTPRDTHCLTSGPTRYRNSKDAGGPAPAVRLALPAGR